MTTSNQQHQTQDPANKTVGVVLNQAQVSERTVTCLALIARMVQRGAHVRVFAHSHAVYHTIGNTPFAQTITDLMRKSVSQGSLTWLVEQDAHNAYCPSATHTPGVIFGNYSDLWDMVTNSDLVLTIGIDA